MSGSYKLLVRTNPHQIIWEVTKAELTKLSALDPDMFKKAQSKIKKWLAEHEIDHYFFENDDILKIPSKLSTPAFKSLPDDFKFHFALAHGYKTYSGINLVKSKKIGVALDITITSDPVEIKSWNMDSFYMNIRQLAQREGTPRPCFVCCQKIFIQAKLGLPITDAPIAKAFPLKLNTRGYTVHADELIGLIVVVSDPLVLTMMQKRKEMLNFLSSEAMRLKPQFQIDLVKDDLLADLKRAGHGKEALGIALPLTFFAGHCRAVSREPAADAKANPSLQPSARNLSPKGSPTSPGAGASVELRPESIPPELEEIKLPKIPANYDGRGLLDIRVAPDKMSASIVGFKPQWYEQYPNMLNATWLDFEMTRLKVLLRQADLIKRVVQQIQAKKPLDGLELVKGDPGMPPEKPYLAEHSEVSVEHDHDSTQGVSSKILNMRKSVVNTVKVGSTIATWAFDVEGVMGRDIFGAPVPPPLPQVPDVNLGEGAAKGPGLSFVAKIDGLVVVKSKENFVDVQRHYIVKGDVSLSTGDIYFDGSITVEGQIRDKATVHCTQDLIVKKGVASAKLVVGGSITVTDGIVNSSVTCKGNVTAGFVENSWLSVKGNLDSKRSLMNCNIVVTNVKCMGQPGLVAGGRIFCNQRLTANNIGFATGSKTIIEMGVDWKHAQKVNINDGRLTKLTAFVEELKKELTVYTGKSAAQMTPQHKESMRLVQKRLKKAARIQAAFESRRASLRVQGQEYNQTCEVIVLDTLVDNLHLKMASSEVELMGACKKVHLTCRRRNNSHVRALPEQFEISPDGKLIDQTKTPSQAS